MCTFCRISQWEYGMIAYQEAARVNKPLWRNVSQTQTALSWQDAATKYYFHSNSRPACEQDIKWVQNLTSRGSSGQPNKCWSIHWKSRHFLCYCNLALTKGGLRVISRKKSSISHHPYLWAEILRTAEATIRAGATIWISIVQARDYTLLHAEQ